jgi:hypothetical protein
MDPLTIAALIKLGAEIGAQIIPLFLTHREDGTPVISIGIILKDTPARNAETLDLIAKANAQPPK